MISRRNFLGMSAAAIATTPLLSQAASARPARRPRPRFGATAPETVRFRLANESGKAGHAYIVGSHGVDGQGDGRPVFIKADGTPFFPPAPAGDAEPVPEDVAIPLDGTPEVVVPRMYGARVYFVTDDKLEFKVVRAGDKPAIAHPDFVSDADPNFGKNWTFAEFTLDPTQLYGNISYVDFVAAPIGLKLDHAGGSQQVPGLPAGAVDTIAESLRGVTDAPWGSCVQEADGTVMRVLNPNHRAAEFAGYLEGYVDEVWAKYAGEPLIIDSQREDVGILEGRVQGEELVFGGERFQKPSSADIWGCNSGPFANNPGSDSEQRKAIVPRLAAAFNRTTLLINPKQPHEEKPETFYQHKVTNHYARVVHENLPDGKGYAFAYDDVSAKPDEDHSGKVNHGEPEVLTVTLGAIR